MLAELRPGLNELLARLAVDDARRRVELGLEVLGLDVRNVVELLDNGSRTAELVVQGSHERRGRNLARLVDADDERVLLGHAALDPRPALGDDAEAVQGAVALLLLDEKVDARRAVELVDNHALGTVYNELAAADHDRDLAEVNVVLDHVLHVLARQANADAEGHAVGQAQRPALVDGVPRLGQRVADVVELDVAVVALDGEHLGQQGLQAVVLALVGRGVLLEEALVSLDLDLDEVGDRQGVAALGEGAGAALDDGVGHWFRDRESGNFFRWSRREFLADAA